MVSRHPGRITDVGLAYLDETATWPASSSQRRIHRLAGQRVEHHIHPAAVRGLQEMLLEIQRAGRSQMKPGQNPVARSASHLPGLRRGEHLGTQIPRDLDSCHPTPPAVGMNQQLSHHGCSAAQVNQAVIRRQENSRNAAAANSETASPSRTRASSR